MVRGHVSRLFLILAAVLAVGCAGSNMEGSGPMEIELDAFSGRPNPTWVASPERAASIQRAVSSLAGAPSRPEPNHLGYRGFIIRQRELQARVYGGHIIVTANGATRTFVDSAGLEQDLIDDARQRGFGGVVVRR